MEGISVFPIQLTRSENCAVKVSTSDEHFLDDRQTGRVIEGVELPPPPRSRTQTLQIWRRCSVCQTSMVYGLSVAGMQKIVSKECILDV